MADQIDWSFEEYIAPEGKLPGDVLVTILTYLPVKSLMKFKAVSKPWFCFISSTRFFKLHLHRQSLLAPNNILLSLMDVSPEQDSKFGLLDLTHDYSTPVDDDVLMLELPPAEFIISDSCNGLVCLGDDTFGSYDLVLWNPATKRYRSVGVPQGVDLDFSILALCYVDAINDFKILVWNYSRHPSPVHTPNLYVYSLSSDSWDKFYFDYFKTDIHFERPTFMGRCMHWLSFTSSNAYDCTCSSASEIVAFDVMDGAISCYRVPVNCCHRHFTVKKILIIGGCLSIVILRDTDGNDVDVHERGYEVWVMEEYGVEGSWVKRFVIQGLTQIMFPVVSWFKGEFVVSSMNDVSNEVLIFYDQYGKKKRYVEFSSYEVLRLFSYVESLASVW